MRLSLVLPFVLLGCHTEPNPTRPIIDASDAAPPVDAGVAVIAPSSSAVILSGRIPVLQCRGATYPFFYTCWLDGGAPYVGPGTARMASWPGGKIVGLPAADRGRVGWCPDESTKLHCPDMGSWPELYVHDD